MAARRARRRCLLARIHSPAATLAVRKSSLINAQICQNHLRSVAVSRLSLNWPSFSSLRLVDRSLPFPEPGTARHYAAHDRAPFATRYHVAVQGKIRTRALLAQSDQNDWR